VRLSRASDEVVTPERLEMTNPRRPRFIYVLSDGGWADTQAGVLRDRRSGGAASGGGEAAPQRRGDGARRLSGFS